MPQLDRIDTAPGTVRIQIDGKTPANIDAMLLSLRVVHRPGAPSRCELALNNYGPTSRGDAGYQFFDIKLIDLGRVLEVMIGPAHAPQHLFAGTVAAIEAIYPDGAPPRLVVVATDRLEALRMRRRSRSYEHVSDEEVIAMVAEENGMQFESALVGEAPQHTTLLQSNQTDLDFVCERAGYLDAFVRMEDGKLRLEPNDGDGGTVSLEYGQGLLSFSPTVALADQVTTVSVRGWDPESKTPIDARAGVAEIAGELTSGRSGSAAIKKIIGMRDEPVVDIAPASAAHALRVAASLYKERARRFVTGSGVATGNAALRPGVVVELGGLGTFFDGRYRVSATTHTFDGAHGYRTSFDARAAEFLAGSDPRPSRR